MTARCANIGPPASVSALVGVGERGFTFTWFCENCALDHDEPFCSACGRNLMPQPTDRREEPTIDGRLARGETRRV